MLPMFCCKGCGRWLMAEVQDMKWNSTPDRPAEVACPFCGVVESISAAVAASWRDKVFGAAKRPAVTQNTN